MISVTCHHCGAHMEVEERYAGGSWNCGACGTPLYLPAQRLGYGAPSPPPFGSMGFQQLPTSGKAIASLVLGLLTFFGVGFCVSGIPGIILGHMAMDDINRGAFTGSGMARAGIVLSWIGLLLPILLVALVVMLGMLGAL